MSQSSLTTRRKALQFLAGVPMLPLGATAATSFLTACGGGDDGTTASFVSASFTSMAAPTLANAAAMATTTVGSTLNIKLSDDSVRSYQLAYQPFFVTGDMVSDGKGGTILSGGYYDINNKPIIDATVAGKERQYFSDSPDGTSLLTVANPTVTGLKGKAVFAVVQFEYTTWAQDGKTDMYGKLPSPIAVLTLDQDQTTGKLSLVKYHNVDTSKVHGLWITCGASLSPWGTHLSSEEYEPDAFNASNAQLQAFSQNLRLLHLPRWYLDLRGKTSNPTMSLFIPNLDAIYHKWYKLIRNMDCIGIFLSIFLFTTEYQMWYTDNVGLSERTRNY